MKRLYASLEQASLLTEWGPWINRVLSAAELYDFSRSDTWEPLKSLSKNIPAMRWLTKQIRLCNPLPPEQPQQEATFYMLAAFCPDNQVLGYVMDTYRYYYRTRNNRGLLSCVRILSLVNQHDEYPHLNVLYNLIMGDILHEYKLYVAPPDQRTVFTFLTGRDFYALEKYLPDFRPFSFRERLQAAHNKIPGTMTSNELARECCMSESVFRKRFKQEFDIPISEWLRQQRKERIERMLRDTDLPLCQIAENNGFNMLSAFSDYCRRNFGESPRQIRKRWTE